VTLGRIERSQYNTLRGIILKNGVLGGHKHLLQKWIFPKITLLLLVIILKFRTNLVFFILTEHLHRLYLCLSNLHPWIGQYLFRRHPLYWVCLEHFLQYRESRGTDVPCCSPGALDVDYLLLEFYHVGGFEGDSAVEHGVEDYSCTPDVRLETFVAFSFENFGGNVSGGTTLLGLHLVFVLDKLRNSKIADFNFTF
jgi:hypothetical protein